MFYQCFNIHCSQRNRLNRQLTSIYVCNCIAANFFLFHFILYYFHVSTVLLAQCLIGLYYTLLCSMFLSDACLGAHVISYDRYILITMAIHIVTASRCNVIQVWIVRNITWVDDRLISHVSISVAGSLLLLTPDSDRYNTRIQCILFQIIRHLQ